LRRYSAAFHAVSSKVVRHLMCALPVSLQKRQTTRKSKIALSAAWKSVRSVNTCSRPVRSVKKIFAAAKKSPAPAGFFLFCYSGITMSLHAKLKDDMKVAMKEKNATTLYVIRMVLASLTNKAIELGRELEEADVLAVIKSDAKKLQDSFESFAQNAREDLAEKAKEEIEVIKRYLPEQMTDGELEKIVREKLTELSVTAKEQAGKVIGVIMKEVQGKADGSRVKKMIDDILK